MGKFGNFKNVDLTCIALVIFSDSHPFNLKLLSVINSKVKVTCVTAVKVMSKILSYCDTKVKR